MDRKSVIRDINSRFSVQDILSRERGDVFGGGDVSVSCVSHDDRKPSMRVYGGKGRHAYCFSCGEVYTPYKVLRILRGFGGFEEVLGCFRDVYGYSYNGGVVEGFKGVISGERVSELVREIRGLLRDGDVELFDRVLYYCYSKGDLVKLERFRDLLSRRLD